MSIKTGDHLGAYTVVDKLGAGGMGEVYRARDTRLERDVAVKVLPDEFRNDPQSRERFEREAKAVAALNHSNILTIHDVGVEGDNDYVVTEVLEGETLQEKLEHDGKLPWQRSLGIATAIASGLAAAHAKGIIHRDIKPSNIFLTNDGGVKILDFGLAKALNIQPPPTSPGPDSARAQPMTTVQGDSTTPGTLIGTIGYMSPEQARGLPASASCDVFSLGCVLYEMLTGTRPFVGETTTDTLIAIIKEEPAPLRKVAGDVPTGLDKSLQKMLQKNPAMRYESAVELKAALAALDPSHAVPKSAPSPAGLIARVGGAIAVVSIVALLAVSLFRTSNRESREDWARETALPAILQLAEEGAWTEAYALALEAEAVIPTDPILQEAIDRITGTITIASEPEGAKVSYKFYDEPDAPWIELGTTNLSDVRLALGSYRCKIEKEGYVTRELPAVVGSFQPDTEDMPPGAPQPDVFVFKIFEEGVVPDGMVAGEAGFGLAALTGLGVFPSALEEFYVDRTEVTNADFKDFVDAGGYETADYWQEPFIRDSAEIPRDQAMALFVDRTGRPGPAGWELGDYPEGEDDFPAGGVSWYEAAAYAKFRGRSLPTIYHWVRAALPRTEIITALSPAIVPMSNFNGRGPVKVGSNNAISAAGAQDMAGNVREWCWNAAGDLRYSMGAGWDDPVYFFTVAQAQSPFDRSPYNGFRCAVYPKGEEKVAQLAKPIVIERPDYAGVGRGSDAVISDEAFKMYKAGLEYEKTPLNARTESRSEADADWIRESVTFDAAYGDERVIAHLDFPVTGAPPYKAAIYFPGSNAVMQSKFDTDFTIEPFDAVPKSGRLLVRPIFAGTFERGGGSTFLTMQRPSVARQLRRKWTLDVQRTIDYLETRDDVTTDDLSFIGFSLGAIIAGPVASIDDRIKSLVLVSGGFPPSGRQIDSTTLGQWSRITVPTILLNGRFDYVFTHDNQLALMRVIGTPEEHTRHVVYETGHAPLPRTEVIKEMLNWLDKYQPLEAPATD